MKKRFVTKKKRRLKLKYQYIVFVIITYLICNLLYNVASKFKLVSSNQELINFLLNDSTYYGDNEEVSVIKKFANTISSIDTSNPEAILEMVFGKLDNEETVVLAQTNTNVEYVQNNNMPRIYIYSTHQEEEYVKGTNSYNVVSGVFGASKILNDKLNNAGINTLRESSDLVEFMRVNNMDYNQSYKASRYYVNDFLSDYGSADIIIDLHRDDLNYNLSTTTINGKVCAKIMFVVGMNNTNYKENYKIATDLNNIVLKKYPSLTRGIYERGAIYNQDLNGNMILLELGGNKNSFDEVVNTIDLLVEVIREYLGE